MYIYSTQRILIHVLCCILAIFVVSLYFWIKVSDTLL